MTPTTLLPRLLSEEEKLLANQRDIELMSKVGGGDVNAFHSLVEIHQRSVVGTIAKMLGAPWEAEDLAQQVFLRVWKSAPRYQPNAQFTTWLFTIVRNLVYNETRRRRRKPTVSMEERAENGYQLSTDTHSFLPDSILPDEQALQTELEEVIDKAIQRLPEKQKAALILRRHQEMPYAEIAKTMSVSEPAVKALIFKARTRIRSSLRPYLED
jgi:RNA polymerase sigma-70 factor (ECF subfamily)